MTVKELIEALEMYDGSMPVYFYDSEGWDFIKIGAVKVKKWIDREKYLHVREFFGQVGVSLQIFIAVLWGANSYITGV